MDEQAGMELSEANVEEVCCLRHGNFLLLLRLPLYACLLPQTCQVASLILLFRFASHVDPVAAPHEAQSHADTL